MSENEKQKQPTEVAENKETNKKDKVKMVTNYLLLFIVVMLGFSIVSDRIIPVTDNARVKGY
ncbi:HlyD family secretion protein, partial [Vibrio owensii]